MPFDMPFELMVVNGHESETDAMNNVACVWSTLWFYVAHAAIVYLQMPCFSVRK